LKEFAPPRQLNRYAFFFYCEQTTLPSIKTRLHVLDLNVFQDAEIPDDITVREVINDVADQLSLPQRSRRGEIIVYKIRSKTLGRFLMADETLAGAGVPSDDDLFIHRQEIAGGDDRKSEKQIKLGKSTIGLSLDDLAAVDIRTLLANEPALLMTLHNYRASLTQLEDSSQELRSANEEIRHLNERLKERNIATVLLLLGQVQIGFGTNLITNSSTGGWFVLIAGLAMNVGALFLSFFRLKR